MEFGASFGGMQALAALAENFGALRALLSRVSSSTGFLLQRFGVFRCSGYTFADGCGRGPRLAEGVIKLSRAFSVSPKMMFRLRELEARVLPSFPPASGVRAESVG